MPKGVYSHKRIPAIERLLAMISITHSGCWEWQGCLHNGYGAFRNNGHTIKPHRFSYEYFNDTKIPKGLEPDHLCHNRACVNPDHLEIVTRKENLNRSELVLLARGAKNRAKTQCPQGHPYDDLNTYHIPTGGRGCKACRREWNIKHSPRSNQHGKV